MPKPFMFVLPVSVMVLWATSMDPVLAVMTFPYSVGLATCVFGLQHGVLNLCSRRKYQHISISSGTTTGPHVPVRQK